MYAQHQPVIQKWAAESLANFIDVYALVILSINSEWRSVGDKLDSVRQLGIESPHLFGVKRSSYRVFVTQADWMKKQLDRYAEYSNAEACLDLVTDLPGMGLAKAGFFLQLCYGLAGCFDRHNLTRFGLDEKAISLSKAQTQTARKEMIKRYVDLCYQFGGSEILWDGWCSHLATLHPKRYVSAEHVSELHIVHLMPNWFDILEPEVRAAIEKRENDQFIAQLNSLKEQP